MAYYFTKKELARHGLNLTPDMIKAGENYMKRFWIAVNKALLERDKFNSLYDHGNGD